jgi:hypothetical protein
MLRLLATPVLLAVLVTPAVGGDAPPAAAPAAATTPVPDGGGATAACECGGGPGKCCGQAAPLAATKADEKSTSGRSCGCAAARQKAHRAPR